MLRPFYNLFYKINGQPRGLITPTKGLRQGQPLSLYLFLICAKGLSSMLKALVDQGTIKGVVAYARGPNISHLFFADDSLIFYRATFEECSNLLKILENYKKASCQQLNCEKTSLFLCQNTP